MALGQSANHTSSLGQYFLISLLPTLVFLVACSTISDPVSEAKQAQIRYLREKCLRDLTNDQTPPPTWRVRAFETCHAWAIRSVN